MSNKQKLISGSRRLTALVLAAVLLFGCLFAAVPAEAKYLSKYESSYSKICSTPEDIKAVFPRIYWSGNADLDELLAAHPNWRFQAFYTGLDWNECFDNTYGNLQGVSEMYYGRNLLQGLYTKYDGTVDYMHPTSWYSTDQHDVLIENYTKLSSANAFNWRDNSWVVISSPNWIQASEEAVRYCMDPRNFFTDEMIFQFEDMLIGKNTYHPTVADVEAIFNNVEDGDGVPGNFWTKPAEETGIVSEFAGSKGKKMTYAEAIYEIGEKIGVSPVFLASRIVQEQGLGTSPLISASKEDTFIVVKTMTKEEAEKLKKEKENTPEKVVIKKKESAKGTDDSESEKYEVTIEVPGGYYYNYFNIEATDGGKEDKYRIYNNGMNEAYNAKPYDPKTDTGYYGPWNTRFRALIGGAQKTKEWYFKERRLAVDNTKLSTLRQSTVYFQKFCVDSTSERCMWGQYMGSLTTPQLESQKAYKSYKENGKLNSTHLFIIPVFNDNTMPKEKTAMPTRTGNPNYKIGSIFASFKEMENVETKLTTKDKFGANLFNYEWLADYEADKVTLYITPYGKDISKILVDGKQIWPAKDTSVKTVNFTKDMQDGDNEFKVECITKDGKTKACMANISRNSACNYEWEVDYENYETTLYISPYAKDTSKILVNGKQIWPVEDKTVTSIKYSTALQIGDNKFEVKCIAQNGNSKVYTLNIHRNGPIVYGDVDADGSIDVLDINYILNHIVKKRILTGSALEAADVDGDGTVDVLDINFILSYIVGRIKSLPR